MAWLAQQPRRRYRDDSPKRLYPDYQPSYYTRFRPRSLRRSRVLSWCFCIFVALAIAFWPRHRKSTGTQGPHAGRPVRHPPAYRPDQIPRKKPRPVEEREQAEHFYRPDGLVDVNPKGRHPILELIERSETQWKRKVDQQSRTLDQAVKEYKRRYGRLPPKGFEIWWDYVDFHDVQLVDEYDSIHARLERFWGVDPRVLQDVRKKWEAFEHTFTIGKVDGADIALLNETMAGSRMGSARVQDQLDILEDVQEWLPDFRATFTMHDGPSQFVSYEMRRRAEEAASVGEYIDVTKVARSILDTGWAAGCPPGSPVHTYNSLDTPTSPSSKKRFIHDHRLSMDPCLHPSHFKLNGYLSQYRHPNPHSELVPMFSICASTMHSDILTAAPEQFEEDVGPDPVWDEKADERLLWRGSNTGILHRSGNGWNVSHRIRFVEMTTRRGTTVRVLTPRNADDAAAGHGDEYRTSILNPAFFDVAFVGKPIQCVDPVCDELKHMFEWRAFQTSEDSWQYKYIMDIDGNGWSARFKRLMTSKSLVFKSTIFPEWYTERIMPWVHYIPIQLDLSDLYDTLMFFRGDLSGMGAHDELARKIAAAGKKWSETFYRREDMTAYHFRLFLEYARVMSEDREAMSYTEDVDDA